MSDWRQNEDNRLFQQQLDEQRRRSHEDNMRVWMYWNDPVNGFYVRLARDHQAAIDAALYGRQALLPHADGPGRPFGAGAASSWRAPHDAPGGAKHALDALLNDYHSSSPPTGHQREAFGPGSVGSPGLEGAKGALDALLEASTEIDARSGTARDFPHRPNLHHVFPQEAALRAWIEERMNADRLADEERFDVDDYTVLVGRAHHEALHKWWNDEWHRFKAEFPDADRGMIEELGARMMEVGGIMEEWLYRHKDRSIRPLTVSDDD
jgi:hypothetical protein